VKNYLQHKILVRIIFSKLTSRTCRPCRSSSGSSLASHRGGPDSRLGSMWDLWTKRNWGRFSPSTSVSPGNYPTNFSIIIITWGWDNRPISGRSWAPPPTIPIKKNIKDNYMRGNKNVHLVNRFTSDYFSLLCCILYSVRLAFMRQTYETGPQFSRTTESS
jgi:hypothetical protein